MAIYHLSLKLISRGKGKSAVAAAAYRAGEKITNEYDGVTHDYSRKRGVVHAEILLPQNAPIEYKNRAVLWNEVEKIEKAKNSRLARDFDIALPIELSFDEQKKLIIEYCNKTFVAAGMVADICIHDTKKGNPHAHIMTTVRPLTPKKTWGEKQKKVYELDKNGEKIYDPKKKQYKCKTVKLTDWDNREKLEEWRKSWCDICNNYLTKNGVENIDHRSFKRQGKDELPTIHLGTSACQMEQRGMATERGNINREIQVTNREINELKRQLCEIDKWLKLQSENKEPTLAEFIDNAVQKQHFRTQHQKLTAYKKAAKLINFVTENDIEDYDKLYNKVDKMHNKLYDVSKSLKSTETRLKEAQENVKYGAFYREHKAVYETYFSIEPSFADKLFKRDTKADFYETNRTAITLFETAEKHLKKHLKAGALPMKKWKSEVEKLTVDKKKFYVEYYRLKDEVAKIDKVKREVDEIVRVDTLERAGRYLAQLLIIKLWK